MNKEAIIKYATEQFLSIGYKTVTMDDVASDLGISKKTLYELIGNKINLIEASVQYQLDELQLLFKEVQAQDLDAIEEILTISSKIKNRINTPGHNTAIFQLQKYYTAVYRKIYISQLEFAENLLRLNLIKGQKQELYRKDVEPAHFAEILMITQNSLKCSGNYKQDVERISQLTDLHFDLILRGILTSEGLAKYQKIEILSNEK